MMRNQHWRKLLPTFAIVVLSTLLLAGCGAARSYRGEASVEAPAPAAPAADFGGALERQDEFAVAQDADGSVADGAAFQRKVIARATVELVVADTEAAVDAIDALMDELGGYVSNANLYKSSFGGSELLRGTLTLRVPAESLEDAMQRLEALAVDVRNRTVDRQDVTDQYSDLDAQIRNLQATENELRELLAEVRQRPNATAAEILEVHRSLTDIRGQIEQAQGRKNVLDNLIGLSTIDVTLTPDAINLPVVEEGWRPALVARDAMRTLVSAMQGLGDVAIWLVIFALPLALVAAIPFVLLFLVARGFVRRARRKKESTAAQA
jgi:hypothetical protein